MKGFVASLPLAKYSTQFNLNLNQIKNNKKIV